MDRRAQRTRGVLIDAFIDLVLSRGYAGITTAEITAGPTSASTFTCTTQASGNCSREPEAPVPVLPRV